jgi:hypothetical protein
MKTIDLNSSISGLISNLFLKSQISRNLLEGQLKKYMEQKILNDTESQASKISRQYQFFALWTMT